MTDPKDTSKPLLYQVPGNGPAPHLGPALTLLCGTWHSPANKNSATGYNVMPLPTTNAPGGFINKNFLYYEEMTFTSPGNAPNRGGGFTQSCNALTYEQRVYFADGPAENSLVHFENGLWLNLTTQKQMKGAYPSSGTVGDKVPDQPAGRAMVKQVSVPHGNSILATGSVATFDGAPAIPDTEMQKTLPFSSATEAEIPIPDPNQVLKDRNAYLMSKDVTFGGGHSISVSSSNAGGNVDNILFEDRHAQVTGFDTTFWIALLRNTGNGDRWQLQYSQTIHMILLVNKVRIPFLHVDANTLLKVEDPYIYTNPSLGTKQNNYPVNQTT